MQLITARHCYLPAPPRRLRCSPPPQRIGRSPSFVFLLAAYVAFIIANVRAAIEAVEAETTSQLTEETTLEYLPEAAALRTAVLYAAPLPPPASSWSSLFSGAPTDETSGGGQPYRDDSVHHHRTATVPHHYQHHQQQQLLQSAATNSVAATRVGGGYGNGGGMWLPPSDVTIHKVTLTQKGYIQFLRYIVDVPTMLDFTFCIWIRSHNLTHAHPLLSYSLHEEQRLIRAWISPQGAEINLSLMAFEIFKVPVRLKENHWYHICQSWDSNIGTWSLYLNGKLKASGQELPLQSLEIPAGGDMVVGQEYTDFDKGLDDGIEGDIFGFNFVLSPAGGPTYRPWPPQSPPPTKEPDVPASYLDDGFLLRNEIGGGGVEGGGRRRNFIATHRNHYAMRKPTVIDAPDIYSPYVTTKSGASTYFRQGFPYHYQVHKDIHSVTQIPYYQTTPTYMSANDVDIPHVLGYFPKGANRNPKGFMDFTSDFVQKLYGMFNMPPHMTSGRPASKPYPVMERVGGPGGIMVPAVSLTTSAPVVQPIIGGVAGAAKVLMPRQRVFKIGGTKYSYVGKSLGMALVELGYGNCALGKGSPVHDDRVLISWTRTPVRVFGGAVLRSEPPFCTKY